MRQRAGFLTTLSVQNQRSFDARRLPASARRRFLSRAFLPMTPLEPRQFLSVTAASLLGPQEATDTYVYSVVTPGVAAGTLTHTYAGTTQFNGVSTTEADNVIQIPGVAPLSATDYYGFDSSGNYVFYGSSGNGITITNSTPGILDPALLVANQTHSFSFTENYSNGTTAVVTHTPKLLSETPTSLTVGAGTFQVYEIDDTVTTSTIAGTVLFQYFLSPGIGQVQLFQTVHSPSLPSTGITTTYELTSVSGPGIVLPSTNQLAFAQQPSSVAAGSTLTPAVVVDVEDSSGNLLTSDNSMVTLSLSGNATLGGTVSVAAVNGVTTFSDLTISSGGNYTLTASDGSLVSATSDSFAVSGSSVSNSTPLTVAVTSSTIPSSIVAGAALKGAKVSLAVTNTSNLTEHGNVTISLYASNDGTIDGSSTRLETVTLGGELKPSAHVTVTFQIPSIASSLLGSYTLFGQVTGNAISTVTSAAGPTFTAVAPFTSFSESIVSVTGGNNTLLSGETTKAVVRLLVTNTGNVQSSGDTTLAIFASPDNPATDGTVIRSITGPLIIKPSKSLPVSIPLLTLPGTLNGNYFFVVQTTDSASDITSVASGRTYAIDTPFVSLVPTSAPLLVTHSGAGVLNVTIANQGNIPTTRPDTLTLAASTTTSITDGTTVFALSDSLRIAAHGSTTVRIKLTKEEVITLQNATLAAIEVTDFNGTTQTLDLTL